MSVVSLNRHQVEVFVSRFDVRLARGAPVTQTWRAVAYDRNDHPIHLSKFCDTHKQAMKAARAIASLYRAAIIVDEAEGMANG